MDMVPLTFILREIKYFQTLTKSKGNFTQIVYCDIVINWFFGRGTLIFHMGIQLAIGDTLLYPNSTYTLLSYKNIRHKGFHMETDNDNNNEY